MKIAVYVPRPDTDLAKALHPASGVVGTQLAAPDDILIDYEGNLYGVSNIATFADRVSHAADRHESHYPTIARRVAKAADLIEVGEFDGEIVNVYADRFADLAHWLNPKAAPGDLFDPLELLTGPGAAQESRR